MVTALSLSLAVAASMNTNRVATAAAASLKIAATRVEIMNRGWVTDLERGHEQVEMDIRAAGR